MCRACSPPFIFVPQVLLGGIFSPKSATVGIGQQLFCRVFGGDLATLFVNRAILPLFTFVLHDHLDWVFSKTCTCMSWAEAALKIMGQGSGFVL